GQHAPAIVLTSDTGRRNPAADPFNPSRTDSTPTTVTARDFYFHHSRSRIPPTLQGYNAGCLTACFCGCLGVNTRDVCGGVREDTTGIWLPRCTRDSLEDHSYSSGPTCRCLHYSPSDSSSLPACCSQVSHLFTWNRALPFPGYSSLMSSRHLKKTSSSTM